MKEMKHPLIEETVSSEMSEEDFKSIKIEKYVPILEKLANNKGCVKSVSLSLSVSLEEVNVSPFLDEDYITSFSKNYIDSYSMKYYLVMRYLRPENEKEKNKREKEEARKEKARIKKDEIKRKEEAKAAKMLEEKEKAEYEHFMKLLHKYGGKVTL